MNLSISQPNGTRQQKLSPAPFQNLIYGRVKMVSHIQAKSELQGFLLILISNNVAFCFFQSADIPAVTPIKLQYAAAVDGVI